MKIFFMVVCCLPLLAFGQQDSVVIPEPATVDLQLLIAEAMMNNPSIKADLSNMDVMEARVPQLTALDYPELKFMQEEMPDFTFDRAMFSRIELSQMIPFPTKLGTRGDIARLQAEHAHHDHLETINDVIAKLKSAYYELWFVQQNSILDQENARLLNQFVKIAQTKYGVGSASQQDVLKGEVEQAMITDDLIAWRQKELSAKAMLMSLLDRNPKDSIGFAVIPEQIMFDANIDSLIGWAMQNRPMIIHDSLTVVEEQTNLTIAKQEYLPDFKFALERVTSPSSDFRGWSVSAGITLPFAPWTLGKVSSRNDEATAAISRAQYSFNADRNMIRSNIEDLYYKVDAGKRQLTNFRTGILPQARQSVNASLTAYQTGTADFLMLIDAYRTYVSLTKDYFMIRMQFEQNIALLQREVGSQDLSNFK